MSTPEIPRAYAGREKEAWLHGYNTAKREIEPVKKHEWLTTIDGEMCYHCGTKWLANGPEPKGPCGTCTHNHDTYTNADADRPDVICDSNGEVVLDLCKNCGLGEAELLDNPVCAGRRMPPQFPPVTISKPTILSAPIHMRDFVPDIRAAAKDTGFNCNHTLTNFLENLLNRVLPKP